MLANTWGDKFSYRTMQDLARFSRTYNLADQQIAADTNTYNIQSTGTGACVINSVYVPSLTADDALSIITEQTAPTATTESWDLLADAGTAFVVDDEVYTGTLTSVTQKFYKCLVAHTPTGSDCMKPADRTDLWQAIPNADTLTLDDDETAFMMITAESSLGTLGTLGIWIACTELGEATVAPANGVIVPYFDPSYYVVVAFALLTQNYNDCDDGVVGYATAGNGVIDWTATRDATYYVQLGPVYPHIDNMPKN